MFSDPSSVCTVCTNEFPVDGRDECFPLEEGDKISAPKGESIEGPKKKQKKKATSRFSIARSARVRMVLSLFRNVSSLCLSLSLSPPPSPVPTDISIRRNKLAIDGLPSPAPFSHPQVFSLSSPSAVRTLSSLLL